MNNPSATEKVSEIMEKVKMKSSILAHEELIRGTGSNGDGNPANAVIGAQHKQSKLSNSSSIISFSDSIYGRNIETFVEGTQCNLYDEIKAEIEYRMEEEMMNKPAKEKERNYGYLKKVSINLYYCLIIFYLQFQFYLFIIINFLY